VNEDSGEDQHQILEFRSLLRKIVRQGCLSVFSMAGDALTPIV
jgi:hypothetical protein